MRATHDPTEIYLETLLTGDRYRLLGEFAAEPAIDDPLGGRVRDVAAFNRFFDERQAWLVERQAIVEPLRTTCQDQRTVCENMLRLQLPEGEVALPVAVVGDLTAHNRLRALRVYHSLWPLIGAHHVRPPLLHLDPALVISDVIAEYQRALHEGDIPAIVAAFEPEGYFREPAGGEYIHRGRQQLHDFMARLLGSGGIHLEHCTATDDGVACAIEFNAVKFGPHTLQPQAGVAVYERGPSGRLHAARIYDDVNVEALAGS
jgi:SnoaL-like domain